jgi:SARP family transcriptional regulator, regulator of embCAB operon
MAETRPLAIRVLGPFEVTAGPTVLSAGGPKQRAVLAAFALRPNRVVSTSELVEALWEPDAAGDKRHSLQQHVSTLRRFFADHGLDDQVAIAADGSGYRMSVERTVVDAFEFEALRMGAREALGQGRADEAAELLGQALSLWRGDPLADFADLEWFAAQARSLAEERLAATEDVMDVRLALGQHRDLVAELESLVAAEPFRERLWAQLMLALYRSDRQAEALAAFGRARAVLVEELGIEPGQVLRDLEARVLAHDDTLLSSSGPRSLTGPETVDFGSDEGAAQWRAFLELPDSQQVHLGPQPVTIGRRPDSTVRLNDNRVSRRHAVVEPVDGHFVVVDQESTNGTFVNGSRVVRHALDNGDELSFGGVTVRFRVS